MEAAGSSTDAARGPGCRGTYEALQFEDSELASETSSLAALMERYTARRVNSDPVDRTTRTDIRAGGVVLLVVALLSGVSLVVVGMRNSRGNPKHTESHHTVEFMAFAGEGLCMPYGGHLHPNGAKCCSAKCIVGNKNFCGAVDCQDQGELGVLNCCGNTTWLPYCGSGTQVAPCLVSPSTTTSTTTTSTSTTTTTTTPVPTPPVVHMVEMTTTVEVRVEVVVQTTREVIPVPLQGVPTSLPDVVPKKNCRSPGTSCAVSFYGVADSKTTVCCDRECGSHCGRPDCAKGVGGEALCCADFILKHSVNCSQAGISPCVLEPLCEEWGSNPLGEPSLL